jgi:hypothetical protein
VSPAKDTLQPSHPPFASCRTAPVLKWRLRPKKKYGPEPLRRTSTSDGLGSVPSLTDCCLRKIDANLENYTAEDFRSQINPVQAKWVIKWVTRARNNTLSTPVLWIAANLCGKESAKEADSAHFVSLLPEEILHHVSTHLALKEMQIPRSADFSVITTLSLPTLSRKHNARISELRHLPFLAFLILTDSEITDDSLRNLTMGLQLQGSPEEWKGLWRLRGIWLDGSRGISDKSIKNLWRFPMLNVISKQMRISVRMRNSLCRPSRRQQNERNGRRPSHATVDLGRNEPSLFQGQQTSHRTRFTGEAGRNRQIRNRSGSNIQGIPKALASSRRLGRLSRIPIIPSSRLRRSGTQRPGLQNESKWGGAQSQSSQACSALQRGSTTAISDFRHRCRRLAYPTIFLNTLQAFCICQVCCRSGSRSNTKGRGR